MEAFPNKKNIISNITLSRFTIERRIKDLSENKAATLRKRIAKLEYFFISMFIINKVL